MLALAAAPLHAADPAPERVKKAVERVADRDAFAPAFWGIEVRSLGTGKVLYARNAEKNLKPASTLKLVTTAAFLDAFGPEDHLRTTVETTARQDGLGRILGDVYLVGRGDTSLSARFSGGRPTAAFEEMADRMLAAGVRRIEGRIVGHEGLFRGERRGDDWGWGDLVWWYGAEVSALCFNDGSADISVGPGERPGDPVVVDAAPASSYYSVVVTATTGPAGVKQDLTLTRAAGANVIRLSGTLPLGSSALMLNVALEDPARYAATVFAEVLQAKGIRVAGPVATTSDPPPAGLRVLASHDGPPVAEMLKAVNKPSQNLHAEMMLRLLGVRAKGDGSVEAGRAAVQDFLGRVGIAPAHLTLQDGSGLSRSDLATPHDIVTLLAAMDRHRFAAAFRESLPIAGVDGTLKGRMRGSVAERRLVAKTGSMREANALAGYLTTRSGARLVFALMVSHHTLASAEAIAAIDEIAVDLAGL
jgi:D-alanyl-D-alanine carboxypeptidase/D-alanyl-D-alanine-endopeptidase (penicillin-binding protein 4)